MYLIYSLHQTIVYQNIYSGRILFDPPLSLVILLTIDLDQKGNISYIPPKTEPSYRILPPKTELSLHIFHPNEKKRMYIQVKKNGFGLPFSENQSKSWPDHTDFALPFCCCNIAGIRQAMHDREMQRNSVQKIWYLHELLLHFFIAKAWNNILRVKKSVPFRKSPKYVSKYELFGRRQGICSSDSNFFQRKSRNNQGTYQQQKLLRNRPNSCQMVVVRYISKASKDSCWLFENAVGKICSTEKTEKTREISNKQ